jgi:nitric oxide reductase NorD protein
VNRDPDDLGRFRLLASYLAHRPLDVRAAPSGQSANTDGQLVFVSAEVSSVEQRRQAVVQAALLGAGSLEPEFMKPLLGRSKVARRYLALEGRRVLANIAGWMPIVTEFGAPGEPSTVSAAESLDVAGGRRSVAAPPDWFGVIRPWALMRTPASRTAQVPNGKELRVKEGHEVPEYGDEEQEEGDEGKPSKLFQNPLTNSNALTSMLSQVLGASRSVARGVGAADLQVQSVRRSDSVGSNARPVPIPLRFVDTPGAAGGMGGALYPEWDVHHSRYRREWCRAIEFPLPAVADVSAGGVEHDEVLRRRLARVGLGPKVLRRRPDGGELDVDALMDLAVDLQAGHSTTEHIYLERRKLARNLGVLILVDASGSATDTDNAGLSVHEHQQRAAATLAVTLEELGDRVAVYGFRSRGRSAVHLLAIKPFGQRFGAGGRAQLNQLKPAGYTRMGAAIRHATELLKNDSGTPNRLLVVLSDGFPYDDGYESSYAEADVHKAIEETRSDGVACLCLTIGASTPSDALDRVFGSSSHANATKLSELSPRMDEFFLGALKELAVGQSRK